MLGVNKKVYIMSSELEVFLNQLKKSGYEILVNKFSQEIISAKEAAESLTKTMPDSHHMYDEPSNVFTPNKIDIDNNE